MEDIVQPGISPVSDSLALYPYLRDLPWQRMKFEEKYLFYTKDGNYYVFCHENPLEMLQPGQRMRFLYWAFAADPKKPISVGNIDDCIACASVRNLGGAIAPECIHIRAARELANYN